MAFNNFPSFPIKSLERIMTKAVLTQTEMD